MTSIVLSMNFKELEDEAIYLAKFIVDLIPDYKISPSFADRNIYQELTLVSTLSSLIDLLENAYNISDNMQANNYILSSHAIEALHYLYQGHKAYYVSGYVTAGYDKEVVVKDRLWCVATSLKIYGITDPLVTLLHSSENLSFYDAKKLVELSIQNS